jgi:hypothetical protein
VIDDDEVEVTEEPGEDVWECGDCDFEAIGEVAIWRHIMSGSVVVPPR